MTYSEKDFRMVQLISGSLRVYYRNIISFTLISALAWTPNLWQLFVQPPWQGETLESGDFELWVLNILMMIAVNAFLAAIIVHASFQDINVFKINWRHSIGRVVYIMPKLLAVMFFHLPIIVCQIFYTLGLLFYALFLAIPSLYLVTRWYIAVSSCVIEDVGPLRSLTRSRDLTKGLRWKIFLLILGFLILRNGFGEIVDNAAIAWGMWGQVVAALLWEGVIGAFEAVSATVIYYRLRVGEEGATVAAFD